VGAVISWEAAIFACADDEAELKARPAITSDRALGVSEGLFLGWVETMVGALGWVRG